MIIRTRPLQLLLIEDNPGDIRLTQEAFKESSVPVLMDVVTDGEEALFYLHKTGKYADKMTPDLIMLDLNLPKKDGREVLREIKSDQVLKTIPVIILSTSNAESDVLLCYQWFVNCYINKPVDYDHFFSIIKKIENFWLKTAFLPTLVR
jgi:chemotaxis family two-component system response regulator Rcp1